MNNLSPKRVVDMITVMTTAKWRIGTMTDITVTDHTKMIGVMTANFGCSEKLFIRIGFGLIYSWTISPVLKE